MASMPFQVDLDRYGPAGTAAGASLAKAVHIVGIWRIVTTRTFTSPAYFCRAHCVRIFMPCMLTVGGRMTWLTRLVTRSVAWTCSIGGKRNYRPVMLAARHPVFVSLRETIREFSIPIQPFADLLVAFRQDQNVHRYDTADDVLHYCHNSANPVGRLVLYWRGLTTSRVSALSDSICTGLQLANFCQDVGNDWERGRIYLPLGECQRFGYDEGDFAREKINENFRRLLASEVDRAADYLRRGLPLVDQMPRGLAATCGCSPREGWRSSNESER